MLELVLAASGTALATGLGAVPVWMLGQRAEGLRPGLLGLAAGVMSVAAVAGLLLPALDEGTPSEVIAGSVVGIGFLLAARRLFGHRAATVTAAKRTSALVFL